MHPKYESVSRCDVDSSFYHAQGMNHDKEYQSPTGRRVMIVGRRR